MCKKYNKKLLQNFTVLKNNHPKALLTMVRLSRGTNKIILILY